MKIQNKSAKKTNSTFAIYDVCNSTFAFCGDVYGNICNSVLFRFVTILKLQNQEVLEIFAIY